MPDYETFEHDVLVIGAGGAGLRGAIEASAAGARVGLVCKSLLGKAHTVMAEGGIARSEEHTSELQSRLHLVCRLLLEKKKIASRRDGKAGKAFAAGPMGTG